MDWSVLAYAYVALAIVSVCLLVWLLVAYRRWQRPKCTEFKAQFGPGHGHDDS